MNHNYDPKSLPRITAVDVVDLHSVEVNRVSDYMRLALGAPRFSVVGEPALAIADLWRRLPHGEQYRCHIPPCGLRFYLNDRVICQASVCWECNNIFGDCDGLAIHYAFDSKQLISQNLLAVLFGVLGRSKPDSDKSAGA